MRQTGAIAEVRAARQDWLDAGERIAFVPTMGNLHKGHASLIERARTVADRVVVSIFVNPTQFGEGEDFGSYPRTPEIDALLLRRLGTDLLFVPEVSDVYPFGERAATHVHVPELTSEFCGAFRPGHFDGVTSVVLRLFCMVQPDVAVFGQKDYQQQLVIRRMVADLSLPMAIETAPTVRDADGLALSSRNQYLTVEERAVAPQLHATLQRAADSIEEGTTDYTAVEQSAAEALTEAGFRVDYFAIRDADTLAPPVAGSNLVVLAAAHLGKARLIDNLRIEAAGTES